MALPNPRHPTHREEPSIDRLNTAERMFVHVFRHWVAGNAEANAAHWSFAWTALTPVFGDSAAMEIISAVETLVRALSRHSTQPIAYHQPRCPCATPDELRLVEMVAAAQSHEWRTTAQLAEELIGTDGCGHIIACVARIALVMAERNYLFALRSDEPRLRVLH